MATLTHHQAKALRMLRDLTSDWERADVPGIGQSTWDRLVTLGYLEERRDGFTPKERFLRLTERGRRATDEGRY
jgi:hypothetical protein